MKKDPWFRNKLIREGILSAIHLKMIQDPSIYILGEGAHMKVHFDAPQIEKDFSDRVITLPISEDANTNFAVGLSLAGITPIVDVISSDFLYRTMDAICNTAAKAACVSEARTIIIRAEFLTGGPTSGQRIEAMFPHIPGLNVVVPSNPEDAHGFMKTALETKGVTIFFEDRTIEDRLIPDYLRKTSSPYRPFGSYASYVGNSDDAEIKLTIISYGFTMSKLAHQFYSNVESLTGCEILDLSTLYPLGMKQILSSVRNTKRLLIVEPDVKFMGIGAEIAATVAEEIPGCRIKRLGAPRVTIPANRDLHDLLVPSNEEIFSAIEELKNVTV